MVQNMSLPDMREIEKLFLEDNGIGRIEAHLSRFNPLHVLKLKRHEIRHSAVLAWLLDPGESHGLGARFIKDFLCEAIRGDIGQSAISPMEIWRADLRGASVRTEWLNIDIFIHVPKYGWAFIIENKFDSNQHSDQLSRYKHKVRRFYRSEGASLGIQGIFLTLSEEEPEDKTYAQIQYENITEILERILKTSNMVIRDDVRQFLHHYLEVIMEATGQCTRQKEMEELAKALYRDHRAAIDFIVAHGTATDLSLSIEGLVGADPQMGMQFSIADRTYLYAGQNSRMFCFLPETWVQALEANPQTEAMRRGCERYWYGYPLTGWIQLNQGSNADCSLLLSAEIGPVADPELRRALVKAIAKAGEVGEAGKRKNIKFQNKAWTETSRYSRFIKNGKQPVRSLDDTEAMEAAITDLINRFRPEFDAVAVALRTVSIWPPEQAEV